MKARFIKDYKKIVVLWKITARLRVRGQRANQSAWVFMLQIRYYDHTLGTPVWILQNSVNCNSKSILQYILIVFKIIVVTVQVYSVHCTELLIPCLSCTPVFLCVVDSMYYSTCARTVERGWAMLLLRVLKVCPHRLAHDYATKWCDWCHIDAPQRTQYRSHLHAIAHQVIKHIFFLHQHH